ncbi:uncharacterized protein LOC125472833 [Pyrus x bretschneideri]|uniref:uncharacterized protein LOC125472833 n=1 Tax=Pyrus x bretschneideri TaxID=225117 RepID=UPI00202EB7BD|nr:uncharacterized protein LOC125472833 [Pyrus x bretschneideri]
MENDEDDEHRRQRASHSRRVMQNVDQISKPKRAANLDKKRKRQGSNKRFSFLEKAIMWLAKCLGFASVAPPAAATPPAAVDPVAAAAAIATHGGGGGQAS